MRESGRHAKVRQWVGGGLRGLAALAVLSVCGLAHASEHHGTVVFNGLPAPGATVTATQGDKQVVAVSDAEGNYTFADLPDGAWKIEVAMSCFKTIDQQVTIAAAMPGITWELKLLPLAEVIAQTEAVKTVAAPVVVAVAEPGKKDAGKAAAAPVAEAPKPAEESSSAGANDGFLVNGSVNNAATSQFSLAQGFGNTRKGSKALYTGGLAMILDNSATDARPYSFAGPTAKASYNNLSFVATLGGPINIPHIMPRGPNFFIVYQGTRDRNANIVQGLVPTAAQLALVVPGSIQAGLLSFYPTANASSSNGYNYQTPVTNNNHQDALQLRVDKSMSRKDQLNGSFAMQSTRSDSANLFNFRDTTSVLAYNGNINWQHRFNAGLFTTLGYRTSRLRTLTTPGLESYAFTRAQLAAINAVQGNSKAPTDFGPPSLTFSSGIASLSDATSAFNRNRTEAVSPSVQWYHGRHNVTAGADFRRQEYNVLAQSNPRGSFTFTGAATTTGAVAGSDFGDFLAGTPDTAALAYGNADKYFRQSVYDAYVTDDWRLRPELTLNVGMRWEYGAPMTELKNRLVNLDVAPGFTAVAPVVASAPKGALTGRTYPNALVEPDKRLFEPRLGLSWRPIPGSSLVVRAGYGLYADTSIYLRNAARMAVQPPLARNLSVPNSAACPLTISNGFNQTQCDADTFGVDPDFRAGFAQTWQLAAQRDLPFALQMTATYLGVKGANGVQQYLPNSYALGAANPCAQCPSGFYYRSTGGTSSRNSGSLQLRRRLRGGFTASAMYTYSKSIDDDSALGGQGALSGGATTQSTGNSQPAQNWRDLHAERSLSTFDQRHLLTSSIQYTSGQGLGGGSLMSGWRGRLLKEWTVAAQINAGSGLPENPLYLATVPGTGEVGILRPNRTGAPLYGGSNGAFLNVAAFSAPTPGEFGNAGRNSITGPDQFTFNASAARTFRIEKKYNLDVRVDSTNLLNHVVYSSWNATLSPTGSNPLFGLPVAANPMRSLQTTARFRF